jgi:hypothetical protein
VENNKELNSLIDENNIKKKDDLNTKIKSINPEKVKEEKVEKKNKDDDENFKEAYNKLDDDN